MVPCDVHASAAVVTIELSMWRMQVRKSWSLKHLTRLEAFPSNRPDGRPLAVELQFGGTTFSNEAKLACEAHTPSELMDLMGTLYLFAK